MHYYTGFHCQSSFYEPAAICKYRSLSYVALCFHISRLCSVSVAKSFITALLREFSDRLSSIRLFSHWCLRPPHLFSLRAHVRTPRSVSCWLRRFALALCGELLQAQCAKCQDDPGLPLFRAQLQRTSKAFFPLFSLSVLVA